MLANLEPICERHLSKAWLMAPSQVHGRCGNSGYRGRVALYEVLPVTREIRALLESSTDEIHYAAVHAGMTTLHQDGVRLCLEGVSSLEEIRRVTGDRT